MDKISHIEKLELEGVYTYARTYKKALVFCLTNEETAELLLKCFITNFELRDILLSKISLDMQSELGKVHEYLVDKLITSFDQYSYRERQSCGVCLSNIANSSNSKIKSRIEKFFLTSKYIGMRRRGYKIVHAPLNKTQLKLIDAAWQKYHDPECKRIILYNFPEEYLLEHKDSLLKVISNEPWYLAQLFIRIAGRKPLLNRLEELKKIDEVTYCYVLAKLELKPSVTEALSIFDSNITDERVGLLIWSFGQLGL